MELKTMVVDVLINAKMVAEARVEVVVAED